jgi:Tfp pilus assembly protein PilO
VTAHLLVQAPQTPLPPVPPPSFPDPMVVQVPDPVILPPWMTLPPQVTVLIALAFFAACTIVLWPLMRAIGRRIEGKTLSDPALREEMEQLRARLSEVDQLQHRVMELEERVDFAERLLAQRREPERLGRGEG